MNRHTTYTLFGQPTDALYWDGGDATYFFGLIFKLTLLEEKKKKCYYCHRSK